MLVRQQTVSKRTRCHDKRTPVDAVERQPAEQRETARHGFALVIRQAIHTREGRKIVVDGPSSRVMLDLLDIAAQRCGQLAMKLRDPWIMDDPERQEALFSAGMGQPVAAGHHRAAAHLDAAGRERVSDRRHPVSAPAYSGEEDWLVFGTEQTPPAKNTLDECVVIALGLMNVAASAGPVSRLKPEPTASM